jgi:hypothetical protein
MVTITKILCNKLILFINNIQYLMYEYYLILIYATYEFHNKTIVHFCDGEMPVF